MECPVCMTLPEGQVHQCNEGHCYCVDCWNRLDPRRCPECRLEVPLLVNRCRAAERAIAALEASCDHCGEATTRGAMAAHLPSARVCPQRPNFCAAAAGCRWKGLAAEQAAHEAACPFAICQRMMAPLQAQNQQVQAQNQQLQVQCTGLLSECQELRALVAPLQAQNQELRGRVRALEGDEEEGGRRQRQRVGAAPHDAPPSDDEVEEMELAEVVAVLRTHVAVARVAEMACKRLRILCAPVGSEQAAAEAGAIEAVVAAMRAHPQEEGVQENGCCALADMCCGDDAAAAVARRQRAAAAGAIEEVVAALRAHPQEEGVQENGCLVLGNMCFGNDAAAAARKQRAAAAGAIEEVVAAMRAHPQEEDVQENGCFALRGICSGGSGLRGRRRRATQAAADERSLSLPCRRTRTTTKCRTTGKWC